MHLFVKTLTGEYIEVDMSRWDHVLEIKKQIQMQGAVPIPRQRLLFGGHILHNNFRVSTILHKSVCAPPGAACA